MICANGLHERNPGEKCIGCRRERVRRYKKRKPDVAKKHWRLWVERHPEENRRRVREWRDANIERARKKGRENFRAHPEVYAKGRARRRALFASAVCDDVTRLALDQLMVSQCGRCAYCDRQLDCVIHLDHRIPLSRGGRHEMANVCWSCERCNRRKHDKTPEEFAAYLSVAA